ncbi:hypothetical protein HCN44_001243 [Aphidius gifuensis]|uniref:Uncharacterized protein n=2 Tax=Aphidius gifuensis TaxID=684658 RepID=A0A835CQ13_APHGI|nr:hypothetical protein HCN44_001243 [Aphidius gifuensis]
MSLIVIINGSYQESNDYHVNKSINFYSLIASALDVMERFKTAGMNYHLSQVTSLIDETPDDTGLQSRSYYGTNTSPAFYPAFDPISILASLAFLAFLLQSFVSLFDRSRSIIPTIINHRSHHNSIENISEPLKFVLNALDEYVS